MDASIFTGFFYCLSFSAFTLTSYGPLMLRVFAFWLGVALVEGALVCYSSGRSDRSFGQ